MISAQAHSAIMRNLGRIEGYAFDMEHDETESAVISNVERICEILEAEMASEGESPTRFAGASFDRRTLPARRDAPFRQGGHSPSEEPEAPRCRLDLLRTMPAGPLAGYLGLELGAGYGGVPDDWYDWLTEPIDRKGVHDEKESRTP